MSRPTSGPPPPGATTAAAPSSGRNYPQDYIVRIRYQNTLPPPPNPPKLLDVPNPAVSDYTGTGFASRLAREQPLNVEVDSELGMPLDLVHVKGVFEKDESCEYLICFGGWVTLGEGGCVCVGDQEGCKRGGRGRRRKHGF